MLEPSLREIIATCPFEPQAVKVVSREWDESTFLALRVWPEPRTAFWTPGRRRWLPGLVGAAGAALANPDVEHGDSRELQGWDVDLRALLAQIPAEVREAIRLLPRIYAWKVLVLIGRVPEALVLVQQHLALAAFVAFMAPVSFDPCAPYPEIERCLQGAPESLLGLLGLPEDPRLVALMDEMEPEVLRELGNEGVMELLQEQSRRWL
jgi:hypothetical protein